MADRDPSFAERLASPAKKIEDCITYILNQVRDSGLNGFDDEEIFSLAVHYYMEDGIDPGTPVQCQVIVNRQVRLSEEEIAEQKRRAREEVFRREADRLRSSGRITPLADKPVRQEEELLLFG